MAGLFADGDDVGHERLEVAGAAQRGRERIAAADHFDDLGETLAEKEVGGAAVEEFERRKERNAVGHEIAEAPG